MTIEEVQRLCREHRLVLITQEQYDLMIEAYVKQMKEAAEEEDIGFFREVSATYNGYLGIAYGRSSFEVRDPSGNMVFHTGFLDERPMNDEECLQELKETLELLEKIRKQEAQS